MGSLSRRIRTQLENRDAARHGAPRNGDGRRKSRQLRDVLAGLMALHGRKPAGARRG